MHEGWGGRRHACSTCASPSGTTLSSVENTVHRHRFTQYYHNLQLKIRGVLGAVLDAWMVVRCWVLKSILQEHKKQGRLTSDSDRKSNGDVAASAVLNCSNGDVCFSCSPWDFCQCWCRCTRRTNNGQCL